MVSSSRRITEHYALARIEFGVPDKRLAILRAPEHLHEVARPTPAIAQCDLGGTLQADPP